MATIPKRVDYLASARRHHADASMLFTAGARPNAGQLYGLSVECAVKAVLVRLGAATSADGTAKDFMRHLPELITEMAVLPDGRPIAALHAAAPHLSRMQDWSIAHRYYRANAVPLESLPHWQAAAREMLAHLDDIA